MLTLLAATIIGAAHTGSEPPFQFMNRYHWRQLADKKHFRSYRIAAPMEELSEVGDKEIKSAGYSDTPWICGVATPRTVIWDRGWKKASRGQGIRPIPGSVVIRADDENGRAGPRDTSVLIISDR